ncbi:MAG: MOSC domain-containing protein [bacterium]
MIPINLAKKTMLLSELWIYPIKSCRGISCSSALLEERGLQHDRRWMIVDSDGNFLTQRALPKLASISVNIDEDQLAISAPAIESLLLPCSHCHVVTVDQDSGLSSPEPLKTLSTYRTFNGKIYFGQNGIPSQTGTLQTGCFVIPTSRQQ